MPAVKAWHLLGVMRGREWLNTLSSRRSHLRRRNQDRGSSRLRCSKEKPNKQRDRRWRNKPRTKALSQPSGTPGNDPNKVHFDPEAKTRIADEAVTGRYNLTANTEKSGMVDPLEISQDEPRAGQQPTIKRNPRKRTRNLLREAIIQATKALGFASTPPERR